MKFENFEIEKGFREVLDGIKPDVSFDRVHPSLLVEIIEKLGAVEEDNIDLNGWQCDYWQPFKYKDKFFTISGSMYYGTGGVYFDEDRTDEYLEELKENEDLLDDDDDEDDEE